MKSVFNYQIVYAYNRTHSQLKKTTCFPQPNCKSVNLHGMTYKRGVCAPSRRSIIASKHGSEHASSFRQGKLDSFVLFSIQFQATTGMDFESSDGDFLDDIFLNYTHKVPDWKNQFAIVIWFLLPRIQLIAFLLLSFLLIYVLYLCISLILKLETRESADGKAEQEDF